MPAKRHELLQPGYQVSCINVGMDYVLAGGAKDAAEQDGAWFSVDNRFGMRLDAHYAYTLTAAKTFTLAFNVQDATDISGTGAADFGNAFASAVIDTGADTDKHGTSTVHNSLENSRGFCRVQRTTTLSHTSTDICVLAMVATFSEETHPTTL